MKFLALLLLLLLSVGSVPAMAQVGAGNATAAALAQKSPAVQTAQRFLVHQAQQLQDSNLSDADFTFSIPAVRETQIILKTLASRYGYGPTNIAVYNNSFRNPVLSYLTGERLLIIYSQAGPAGVQAELDRLRKGT